MRYGLSGPARYFADHPLAYWASLVGAAAGALAFVVRARRTGGLRRWAWLVLAVFQVAQVVGIWRVRRSA